MNFLPPTSKGTYNKEATAMRSATVHRARVRYIGNPATRAAWRVLSVLPKGKRLGKWWTTTGEWAYCHSVKCECQPCASLPDYGIYKTIGDDSHFDAWQKQEAKKKH